MKELLSQEGATFDERVVDDDPAAYDELLALGYRTVPVTRIGSTIITGFDREAILTALAAGG